MRREDWPRAWHALNAVLNDDSENPEVLYMLGDLLRKQGHAGASLPFLAKALSKEQKVPNIWMNYGAALHDLNRWEEAVQTFSVVYAMLPNDDMPPANIAGSVVNMGKWHDAINWADKALALAPDNYIAQIARTFACLALGRWKDGWKHAEWLYGHHLDVRIYREPGNDEPAWDGTLGQTVVVQCDQGIGDVIMFSQLLPRLQRDCKSVIVETIDRLVPLFRRNFPGIHVYGTLKRRGVEWVKDHEIDAHTHISFLGRFYLNRDEDFERKPYLTADPAIVEQWRTWLSAYPKPWKGIAWQGGLQQTQRHLRSLTLAEFKPILDTGGTFIDLSYHDSHREVALWNIDNKVQVIKPPIDPANFEDTVALLAALDEVACVTTTVAHVCGALGRKVHVLVPEVPQWRYAYRYRGGEELIWYPPNSVKLYRVKGGENWTHALNRVAKALRG